MNPFCSAPWNSIFISPHGRVDTCCVSTNNLGSVSQNIDTVLNSDYNNTIKQKMLDHKRVGGCGQCFAHPEQSYKTFFDKNFPWDGTNDLKFADIRWRNTCNAACVYCSSEFSSLWAKEQNNAVALNRTQLSSIKEWLIPKLDKLERITLAGGEPLLIKDNKEILDELYRNNRNCKIFVSTNLSIRNDIYELLTEFPHVEWMISGENTEEKYEYVRYGSKWLEFASNIEELSKYKPDSHVIGTNMVYHALNVRNVFDYVDYLKELGIRNFALGWVNHGPLDPRHLPQDVQEQAINLLEDTEHAHLIDLYKENFENRIDNLQNFLYTLDNRRNVNSKQLWPEIWNK